MDRTLARKRFNTQIGAIFLVALLASALLVKFTAKYFVTWGLFPLLLIYCAMAFVGVMISRQSPDPKMTIAGFMLVMVPGGIAMNRFFSALGSTLIAHVLSITIGAVVVMIIEANVLPGLFKAERKYMICANIMTVIVLEIISYLFGWCQMKFMPMLIAGAYNVYLCYTWAIAQKYEYTLYAAADTCAEFYLRPIWRIRDLIFEYRDMDD